MTKRLKIYYTVCVAIAIPFAILNFTTDYIHNSKWLEFLMYVSFGGVIGLLVSFDKKQKDKDKKPN